MEQQKRIDKILKAVEARVQDEVGALLGAEFFLDSGARKLVGKAGVFEGLQGKQICAHLEISGDVSGKGCLLIGIKDAIRLGGTLIMLPDTELQEVIGREEYREEVEDSFGEIANIIAGSITKCFEEMYPKPVRVIRKGQEVIVPAKVDVDSDQPIENQQYYLASFPMVMDGRQLGELVLLFSSAAFGLAEEAPERPLEAQPDGQKRKQENPSGEARGEHIAAEGAQPGTKSQPAAKEVAPPSAAAGTESAIADKPAMPAVDFEKQRKRVDKLLAECHKRLITEVSALLGADIFLGDPDNSLVSKEEFFNEHAAGKQVIADMEVVGDFQSTCYFAAGLKDAIHLGGVLIMLPPTELASVVDEEDFTDDITDAYGEVTNIVSGVYTAVFEEQYNRKLRFIRKQLKVVVPLKVDAASAEPMPDVLYYSSKMALMVEGKSLGYIHMLFPADLLQLESPKKPEEHQPVANVGPEAVAEKIPANRSPQNPEPVEKPTKKERPSAEARDALEKQCKRIDKLLVLCRERMQNEVSTLIGLNVQLSNHVNRVIGKEEFFTEFVSGKQVVADMDVVGDLTGKSHLIVTLRDAIRIGGALIMLPTSELESVVTDEEFGEDTQDAFGEIANIVAGVYTGVFEEQHAKRLRFIKTELHQIVPMKVDIAADQPFPNDEYYLSTMDLSIDDLALGKVNVVFPLELFQLEGLRNKGAEEDLVEEEVLASPAVSSPDRVVSPEILLIGDDEAEAGKIGAFLGEMGYSVKMLSFKDNVHNYLPGQLKAIYLVMKEVNEQAFGVAIKVSSACSLPLIAAGPGWTRSKVIKAVKYGVRDILLTPAGKEDIEENVTNNLLQLAA